MWSSIFFLLALAAFVLANTTGEITPAAETACNCATDQTTTILLIVNTVLTTLAPMLTKAGTKAVKKTASFRNRPEI